MSRCLGGNDGGGICGSSSKSKAVRALSEGSPVKSNASGEYDSMKSGVAEPAVQNIYILL